MLDRFDEIEDLIRKLAINGITDENKIYSELCNYGLSEDEIKAKDLLSEEQNRLLKMYRFTEDSRCGMVGKYFLVFRDIAVDRMAEMKKIEEAIKLYVPTNKENMHEVATKLFNYLINNYLIHNTKISKDVRADDLVSRVFEEEDAKGVIDFVNEELSDKIIKTNPFVMREGVVGIARDGKLSYNERVSKFLQEYLITNQANLENVGLEGFRQYMQDTTAKVYMDKEYIRNLLAGEDRKYYRDVSDLDYLYDTATIMELVTISTDKENSVWQIFSVYHIDNTSDYLYIDFNNDEDYKSFIDLITDRSIYNFNNKA